MVDFFVKGKINLFALNETKFKENGEMSWFGVNGIIVGVQMSRAR